MVYKFRFKPDEKVLGPKVVYPEWANSYLDSTVIRDWNFPLALRYHKSFERIWTETGDHVHTNYVEHFSAKTHVVNDFRECRFRMPYRLYWQGIDVPADYHVFAYTWSSPRIIDAANCFQPAHFPGGTIAPDIDSMIEDQIQDRYPRINMVNNILELTDVADLFASIPAGMTRAAADIWLRGKLGAIPMIQDMITGVFAKQMLQNYNQLKAIAEGDGISVRKVKNFPQNQSWSEGNLTHEVTGNWKVAYYAIVKCTLPNYTEKDIYDFSIGANTLWEATPLSFVVDYFLPVGNFFSGISFSDPIIIDIGVSSKYEGVHVTKWNGVPFTRTKIKQYVRRPDVWSTPDGMRIDLDEAFQPISPQRLATLAALARSFT